MTDTAKNTPDARRAPRRRTNQRASARVALTIELIDVSAVGVRMRMAVPLPVGTLIKVGLPGGDARHARIVWRDGEVNGCEFLKPLSVGELALIAHVDD